MTTSKKLRVLLSILSVGKITGLRYDALRSAVADGRLRVHSTIRKPGGGIQPLFALRDVMRFSEKLAHQLDTDDPVIKYVNVEFRKSLRDRLLRGVRNSPTDRVALSEVIEGNGSTG
jgi:hypothetical protein